MKHESVLISMVSAVDWVGRLMWLSLLWIAYSLIGGFVLGLGPATAAQCAVVRRWTRGERDFSWMKFGWQIFGQEFWKANGLFWIMATIGLVLWFDMRYVSSHLSPSTALLGLLGLIPLALFAMTVLYVFPVFAHVQLSLGKTVQTALLLAVASPLRTLAGLAFMVAWSMLAHWVVLWAILPGVFIYTSTRITYGALVKRHWERDPSESVAS